MSEEVVKKLNPWLSIWVKPRETMRQVFGTSPGLIHLLLLLGVFVEAFDQVSMEFPAEVALGWGKIGLIISLYVIIMYPLNYYAFSPFFSWFGSKLGGKGTTERVRYALAYSYIPYFYSFIIIWIPSLLLFGKENFTVETPVIDSSFLLTMIYAFFQFVNVIFAIWALVIAMKCLGEAHEFSAWRALWTVLIPTTILLVAIAIPVSIAYVLFLY